MGSFWTQIWTALTRVNPERTALEPSSKLKDSAEVNGLPLPALLVSLINTKRWCHPGDDVILALSPFMPVYSAPPRDLIPLEFLQTVEEMQSETPFCMAEPRSLGWSNRFQVIPGSSAGRPVELPWLDIEKAVTIVVSPSPGEDFWIVLDYRTSMTDPRIVANHWRRLPYCDWFEIAPSFTHLARLWRLTG